MPGLILHAPLRTDYSVYSLCMPAPDLVLQGPALPSPFAVKYPNRGSTWNNDISVLGQGLLASSTIQLTASYTKCLWLGFSSVLNGAMTLIAFPDDNRCDQAGAHFFNIAALSNPVGYVIYGYHRGDACNNNNIATCQSDPLPTSTITSSMHHACLTYDDNTLIMKAYWDGVQVSTATSMTLSGTPWDQVQAQPITIGYSATANTPDQFQGSVQEVMVFNYSLNFAQIYDLYSMLQ
jgi:hypothetical protein